MFQLVHGIDPGRGRSSPLTILTAIFSLLVGLLLLFNPMEGAAALTLLIGAFFIFDGIVRIVAGFRLAGTSKTFCLLSGIAAVALGGLVFTTWPGSSLWLLGLLLGAELILMGVSLTAAAAADSANPLSPRTIELET